MNGGEKTERRGGRRQRRVFKKDRLGPIDREAISRLLKTLASNVADDRLAIALNIVVRGIEIIREHAPSETKLLSGCVQKNRRALEKLKKGKAEIGIAFNGFMKFRGRLYGTSSSGLYRFKDEPVEWLEVSGLDNAILAPMRTWSALHQRMAGFQNINPNVLYNPSTSSEVGIDARTLGDELVDSFINPPAWDVYLASYVYFAITRGLGINAATSWYEVKPKQMRSGWGFGRLFTLAADQSGVPLPSSRPGMEELLKRGKDAALKIAISYPDGRKFTALEIEFPGI